MRKIIALVAMLFALNVAFATVSVTTPPRAKAADIFIPLGTTGAKISLYDLATMKIKEVEQMTGKKMKFKDRIAFKVAQKQVRDNIAPDGTFDTKNLKKAFAKQQKGGETGFHFGGFALGFFLGLIGVLIAYLINDDFKSNRTKWAWIGVGVVVVLSLLLLI